MNRRLPFAAVLLAFALWATPAASQEAYVHRPADPVDVGGLTVWGIFPYWYGVGAGAHYMMPLGAGGFLDGSGLKDRLALEFGADFVLSPYRSPRLRPAVGVLWTIWLVDEFAIYPKADIGFPIWLGPRPVGNWWWPLGLAGGILYRMDQFDLRAEAGWSGLHAGAVFRF